MAAMVASLSTFYPAGDDTQLDLNIIRVLAKSKTLAAFALGLMLFVVTLLINVFALHIVRKYREQYE